MTTSDDTLTDRGGPAELTPTAQRLVAAARALLARGGFTALTVEAVAAEAGVYRDSVRYHFGSKAAFVAAVVDSLAHEQSLRAYADSRAAATPGERAHALVASDSRLVDERDSFRDFFALLPHVVQDDDLRTRVAVQYEWYRDLYGRALAGQATPARIQPGSEGEAGRGDEEMRAWASLMVAVVDGLAVQKLLDPDLDLAPLFAHWEAALRGVLEAAED